MKENAPKKIRFQTLRTLWMPLAIGVVTVAALAVVVGMVWKDYRTAMMDSQTRQMELVVQSTADSIRVLLEEYADRLDSIAEKVAADAGLRPTRASAATVTMPMASGTHRARRVWSHVFFGAVFSFISYPPLGRSCSSCLKML